MVGCSSSCLTAILVPDGSGVPCCAGKHIRQEVHWHDTLASR